MNARSHKLSSISLLTIGALVLGAPHASADPTKPPVPVEAGVPARPGESPPGGDTEIGLTPEETSTIGAIPLVSPEMDDLADEITATFSEDPRFSAAEIGKNNEKIIVHWHGEIDSALRKMVKRHPKVPVIYHQTAHLPGDLRSAADTLMDSVPEVTGVAVNFDGSGIEVSIGQAAGASRLEVVERFIETTVDFPVEVTHEDEALAAADRGFDEYHLGGGLLHDYVAGYSFHSCTAGFAVEKDGVDGMMFAAHCGPESMQWIISDRVNNPGVAQYYGKTILRNTSYDGAIISSTYSYPYVHVGGVRSTTISPISGQAYANPGDRVCYSGAFTGTRCDSIVQNTYRRIALSGQPDLQDVRVFETVSADGNAAAGNGDSGGPVYTIRNDGTRTAVGIISAMPMTATAEACATTATPGGAGRLCSATVYAGAVSSIAIQTGWNVKVR
ncbi:trypsin-like serine protease [Blastococcus montanus]|uniref:trypsin-like serine protease n=1 Tax=Blastococcus montanus TaxID=3144973 RepID=UPI0032083081